jgi:hypothetical protein
MNNEVYGKCMEQIRNRMNMKLVSDEKSMSKSINQPTFIDRTVYTENLAAVHFAKENIVMNKPIYVGQAILDISKVIMYEFFYSVLKPKYSQNLELLYMDTDSFIVLIKCKDFYKDLLGMLEHYDTSNYEKTHFCYSPDNKKVLGKFKDETGGIPISEFCGLRAKVYALRVLDEIHKKLKGIKKYALKTKIHFADYISCLRDTSLIIRTSFYNIVSKKHILTTNKFTKIALSAFDDKRYILCDGVHTLPWGHFRIPELEDEKKFIKHVQEYIHSQAAVAAQLPYDV